MRTDVEFLSAGVICRGWLYRPEIAAGPTPAIVMSHGFSATRHMGLAAFAELFRAAGFAVLVFDYRCLGDSGGAERGRIIPQEQHDDLRAAIDFVQRQPGIDPERIGLWGTSYSGGHALFVGALDARIKAIVAQVPALAVARSLIGFVGAEGFATYLAAFVADLTSRNAGHPSSQVHIVAPEGQPGIFPSPEAREWFATSAPGPEANWVNHTTLESLARMAEYTPAAFIDLTAKPILLLAAEQDGIIPIEQVYEVFARAREPKELEVYPCGHFGLYPGRPFHEAAAERAAGWFGRWL